MLKVFLVEDEYVAREGIKNNIDWAEEGFDFCGDAADGELAYPIIQSKKPDIIITDIKMPFMNGLELSRLVKKELPETKIIILSGYEEFSYAQEAIKIGVTEYLLKPVNSSELLKTAKRIRDQILLERIEKQNIEQFKKEMEEHIEDKKCKLFNNIIEGSLSIAKILEKGKELDLDLSAQHYKIMLLKYYTDGNIDASSLESEDIIKKLNNISAFFDNIIQFDRAIEGITLLIKGDTIEQLDELCKEYISKVETVSACHPSLRYFGGIGKPVSRLTNLSESYESAARAISYRFILNKNAIISYNELSSYISFEYNRFLLNCDEFDNIQFKKIESLLKNGRSEEISFFIDEFYEYIVKIRSKSLLLTQYIIMNIYFTVLSFLKEIGESEMFPKDLLIDTVKLNEMVYDIRKVKDYIRQLITVAIDRRDIISTKRYQSVIQRAKEYINNHYSDENLSLNEVASFVNISPSHFSAVFSRETGSSFIKYLTDLRLNKAKELLKCSDMSCSEISIAVGYKDPHYFSYLFKKAQNCSPKQYRSL